MKKLICILSLLCTMNCFGQAETKEDFVNEVYRDIIDSSKMAYYLIENAKNVISDKNEVNQLRDELSAHIPASATDEIMRKMRKNKKKEKWNFHQLVNARPYNKDSSRILNIFNGIVFLDPDTAKERIEEENSLEERKLYGGLFSFSVPVFNNNLEYAVMLVSYHCGMLCGFGCIYLYKRENNKWKLLDKMVTWVS